MYISQQEKTAAAVVESRRAVLGSSTKLARVVVEGDPSTAPRAPLTPGRRPSSREPSQITSGRRDGRDGRGG